MAIANDTLPCDTWRMITGQQIRMARQGLGWGMRELASQAKVATNTILRAEGSTGVPPINTRNLAKIQKVLEDGGAEFSPDGSVRIRP